MISFADFALNLPFRDFPLCQPILSHPLRFPFRGTGLVRIRLIKRRRTGTFHAVFSLIPNANFETDDESQSERWCIQLRDKGVEEGEKVGQTAAGADSHCSQSSIKECIKP